jgi:hypothetical protein
MQGNTHLHSLATARTPLTRWRGLPRDVRTYYLVVEYVPWYTCTRVRTVVHGTTIGTRVRTLPW